ncbi:phosphohydrolase [Vibrio albus]|uniref:Phosphohydrolase n=1 Tax=Vibrio albus TaxID=2200953 RepID=A0A2U3BAT1_9VIBR|nr:HD domain-containing phosphohydrolase [Vibrio albus]PWI33834.1 phosphohydrolase [Vibrio albus]
MTKYQKTEFNNAAHSLTERLKELHNSILERMPGVCRVACALYDPDTDLLKTFINSTHTGHAIAGYQYPLSKSYELSQLKEQRTSRIIDNIQQEIPTGTAHSNWLLEQGYSSSFTIPMLAGSQFIGFIFIDSDEKNYFRDHIQRDLILFAKMITLTISTEISAVHSLLATAKAAKEYAHLRDFETGMHLNRMAQFSRLIARTIADQYQFSDETIEHIYLFTPLHDIGKIGIPDRILLKKGRLDAEEYNLMKEHVNKGVHIISQVLEDYQLSHLSDSKVMLNIVAYHHEFLDGSGYPHGLTGDKIPIEAKITTVADIFDALTSKRPYKNPWSIDDAFAELTAMARAGKLDRDCVEALITNREEVTYIVTELRDKDES